ncbi:MAG TPA: hypothetical protein CFH81_02215 [Sulfurovum sp. UBA12169]|nr:MAG TPA: hypothetical protein CFH81_02215 [Sulfurovum sp. UBA12169]
MCGRMNFWNIRTKFRKQLTLKNRYILLLEHIAQKHDVSISDAVNMTFDEPGIIEDAKEELALVYRDFADGL